MRVAVVSRGWWPCVKGGSEKFMYMVSRGLVERGHEVYVVTRPCREGLPPGARPVFIEGLPRAPVVSSYLFSRRAASAVNRLCPDVVVVNSYWGESSLLYIHGVPGVAVVHDVGLFTSPIARRDVLRNLLRRYVLERVVRRADLIVVPTETVRRDLERFLGVDPGRVRVLGLEGVDGPMRREHIENTTLDIVHVGRFSPNKGQLVLLEAVEEILRETGGSLDLRVYLVGGVSDRRYFKRVSERAGEINKRWGREVVVVVPDAEDVGQYYRLADICVAPSVAEEGFGLTVVECMAYGKPVIASDLFEETGVADRTRAVVVPRGDPVALARAVLELARDPARAQEISREGLLYASRHSWEKVVDMLTDYILEVVRGERQGRCR